MTNELDEFQKTLFTTKKTAEVVEVSSIVMRGIWDEWISKDVAQSCYVRLKKLLDFYRNELNLSADERQLESDFADIAEMTNTIAGNIEQLEELAQELGYQLA